MTLAAFCARHKITATSVYLGETSYEADLQPMGAPTVRHTRHNWTVTIRHGRKRMTKPFFTGRPLAEGPAVDDVLGCLLSDASSVESCRDLDDWVANYTDLANSRRPLADVREAEKNYRACAALLPRLRAFLGDLYDAAQSAEH